MEVLFHYFVNSAIKHIPANIKNITGRNKAKADSVFLEATVTTQFLMMTRIERERYVAWVGLSYDDVQIWGQYERLVDFIFDAYPKANRRFDEISLPTLFTISHAIELALKENIKFFKKYHGSQHLTKFDSWAMLIKSHDLEALAFEFKAAYMKLHEKVKAEEGDKREFLKYYAELEKLIKILDRNTETYRYSLKLDNEGQVIKKSIDHSKTIDLYTLKTLFDSVKTLFIGAPNSLGRYTDFIDYKNGNPDYKKGRGFLYCQRLNYTEHFLDSVKATLNEQLTPLANGTWMNSKTGENFEIQVWEGNIYIIAI
jgi:hypothetical protein